ncbi:GH25 family lysozyme [Leifsonia sp. AG29]|uniref:GH25 family lysozyme n=1 Tax=Leifsonia sp. AG29 TaxID=2598860 RepID=UPI00131ECAB0|nr:GH25 family lysozyme [Leifsonia sp. AG29]
MPKITRFRAALAVVPLAAIVVAGGLPLWAGEPAAAAATATSPTTAPASPTPATTSSPTSPKPASPSVNADPDLATQNAAHDHAMGSTVQQYEPRPVSQKAVASPSLAPPGLPGLDVSGWQTNIDWNQVAANGAKFAYVKATESTDYTSSQFALQYNGSYAAGLTRGAYHFAVPNASSGAAQANFFVNNGGGWSKDGRTLPPLLDIEYDPYTSTDGTNTCYGLSAGAMVAWIADFSNTVYQRVGRYPAIYTTTGWWTQCTGNSPAFGANPLFIARYPSNISNGPGAMPAGWGTYTMWQWADAGVFPGDQDVFNGGTAALLQLALTGQALAQPVIGAGDLNGDGKPDILARKPDGSLWFYAGTGASGNSAGYAAGVQVGSGWDIFDDIIAPGDLNGDGKPDLLGRRRDGTLVFYPVTGTTSGGAPLFGAGIALSSGWDMFTDVIAAGDVNGDHRPDLLGRKPDGTLWLYPGTGQVGSGSTGFVNGPQVGTSWNIFSQVVGVGDLSGDGWDDLLALRTDGSLWLYRGSSAGYQSGTPVSASGLAASDLLIAGGDANGDGRPDLLARTGSGELDFYAGTMSVAAPFGAPQTVGSGWTVFNRVIGAGDTNGDGTPDIVATASDGTLWFYAGNGSSGGVNRSYQAGIRIGWGWNGFTRVIGGGDLNGDGRPDLVAVYGDGSLWLYPGTGVVNPASPAAYGAGIRIGSGGWNAFTSLSLGDFDGDGIADILAKATDGTLRLYRGIRQTPSSTAWLASPVVIGSGWNAYSAIDTTGDSNGDGKADVVAQRPDGTLWISAGTGTGGTVTLAPATLIGSGWTIFSTVTGTGDKSPGRTGDLLGVRTDGALLYYPSTNAAGVANVPGLAGAVVAGSGWQIFG